ncbi:putative nucleotide-binding protein with TIR-like domain [Bradyrhizobium sp. R2.2-H]|jgi:predicted nucleotide-binding protein|uniref:TIR domain-containing protein n=1 Tax=unclassified Bradyrhizobium TaxID=2631580 RepID=UPI0010D3C559|nr:MULTISPECIES: nucleotide-binding protein [unclassified Bradyrhizobium]TCU74885.1 putative nucleotide-binding protein with TIR-like domain [Bradyrhizobium sp. Y-H1]TCU77653.1 putative nucleotide-binding protein with TIR-like domain [Bradyrhizobium sp. R2.2-H]
MSIKITGLDEFQREMRLLAEAAEALDGELTTLRFNASDQTSVERAIADMRLAIDRKVAAYSHSSAVADMAAELKRKYEADILARAAAARLTNEANDVTNAPVDRTVFRQIENVVSDLRSSEYNTFDRHIKKLSRILHTETLAPITDELTRGVDLDAWIKAGEATQGGIVGSASLEWPKDTREELGLIILLIDRFAQTPDEAMQFSHTFYYAGNSITANVQNLVSQVFVPFARDYIDHVKHATGASEPTLLPERSGPAARKIFIVHGHDDGAREAVARFLERLGFDPIILHEQANQGRTIIEKIEAHGDVGFAVILLTPDDVGGLHGAEQRPRARQNVMLELGYFIGRLGRARVCALKRGDIEVPSDFGGVVYEPFDSGGGWKQALGRELQAAGFQIDWNVVMRR